MAVSGAATLTNQGHLSSAAGTMSIEKGGKIDNTGGVLTAVRNISLGNATTSGTVIGGQLESSAGGVFVVQKAATLRDVTLGATASLVTSSGATTTISGVRFLNQGVNRIDPLGSVVVVPTTNYVQESGSTDLQGGTLSSTGDVQIQGGTLSGFGTIGATVVSSGTLRPEGALRIQGDYHQTPSGEFTAVLGPSGSGSALDVTGTATLDGGFQTTLATDFQPVPGDRMSVLSYGTASAQFASFDGAIGDPSLVASLEYGAQTVDLVISQAAAVGGPRRPPSSSTLAEAGARASCSNCRTPRR